jgi:hypothetical protein
VDRHLCHAAIDGRRLDPEQVQHGRGDVHDVVELVAQAAAIFDAGRPVDDQRIAGAAGVDVLLVPLERRVAGLRPTHRVVRVGRDVAQAIQGRQVLGQSLRLVLEVLAGVDRPDRPALRAGAVVGDQDQQSVVQRPEPLQVRH